MQKTISKMCKAIGPNDDLKTPNFSLAETLKYGMERKYGNYKGVNPNYEYVIDTDS